MANEDIAGKLAIPSPTVKQILTELQTRGMIEKQGSGCGTVYFHKN